MKEANNYIAGHKTAVDWYALKDRLLTHNLDAWKEAFNDYFMMRLDLRYLQPILKLQDTGTFQGEGFSIVAIQCSLIEFLESTAQGKNYRYMGRNEEPGPYEYKYSKDIFVAFLQNRKPFSSSFNEEVAKEFYINIRCGLLHEARTKNGWRIWAANAQNIIDADNKILYRNNFQAALLAYIKKYGEELQTNIDLQQAFIRKFDSLSIE